MTVTVRDARGQKADRQWIESVYRDYLDDLAPLNTGMFPALGEFGHREPDQLGRWFSDPAAQLLLILHDQTPAGFALVTPGGSVASGRGARCDYRMAEFFIARPQRRRGVGKSAVRLILDRFSGTWEIIEYLRNPGAVNFWRKVVAGYTGANYEERVVNGEVRQTFTSGRRTR
ncbi:MAG: GNAT family N-acetyltransferase [Sphingomonadales bacterium]|nr:MAG: GNAT family N-acetyltransferase [Sphingomonadales bacterium]